MVIRFTNENAIVVYPDLNNMLAARDEVGKNGDTNGNLRYALLVDHRGAMWSTDRQLEDKLIVHAKGRVGTEILTVAEATPLLKDLNGYWTL
jgi:hypothetical protein